MIATILFVSSLSLCSISVPNLVRRIGTLNCGHSAYPIIMGVSSQQYTPEQLEAMRSANAEGIDYDGRHYTGYEATQHQRVLLNEPYASRSAAYSCQRLRATLRNCKPTK